MGELGKFLLDSVKWLTSLRTAAQQLVAALFMLVGILMGTVYFLYKQNIRDREASAIEIQNLRIEHRADIAAERIKTEAAMKAATDCMNEKFTIVQDLLNEQKNINRDEKPLASTRRQLANRNEKYINSIKKDVPELVRKAIQQRQ